MKLRRLRLKRIVPTLVAMLVGLMASCGGDNDTIVVSTTESLRIYEMIAGKGSFSAVDGDTTGTAFQLSLSNVPREILYFTDRPARQTGTETVANLVNNIWPRVYGEVAPNAVMKATTPDQGVIELFCVLDKPVYNAATGQLGFTVTYLNGNRKPGSGLAVTDLKLIIMNNTNTSEPEWLQFMTGGAGTFEPTSTAGIYTFRLRQPGDPVFSFTSAPGRQSMSIPVKEYIQGWQNRFGDISPNVSISYDPDGDQAGGVQIATLSNPVYDEQTGTASFTAKVLSGSSPIGKGGLTVKGPSLFLDGGASDALTVKIHNNSGRSAYIQFYSNSKTVKMEVHPDSAVLKAGGSAVFSVVKVDAGRINISYDKKLNSGEPDGARKEGNADYLTRFDKVEFTYKNRQGKANLTAVDFYSIPMILETSIQGVTIEHLTLAKGMSGKGLEKALTDKNTILSDNSSAVVKNGNETVRILSPVKRPGAYHGFDAYLKTLTGSTLAISGTFFGTTSIPYSYTGSIASDFITLKDSQNTIKIAMSSLLWDKEDAKTKNGIYTCNGEFYVNNSREPSHVGDNTLYSAVYRDLVTALNLGFVKPGANDSAGWWQGAAVPFTGTYNTYAKIIADQYPGAYGFPFSDRYKHILADLGGGDKHGNGRVDTLTITLLGDTQVPPPYNPSGTLNPDPGKKVTHFNLSIVTGDDNFDKTNFTFHKYINKYKGGTAYDFPLTEQHQWPPGNKAATINNVPAVEGLNMYDLALRGKKFLVLVLVRNKQVQWGSISGGGNGNYEGGVLYVGGLID